MEGAGYYKGCDERVFLGGGTLRECDKKRGYRAWVEKGAITLTSHGGLPKRQKTVPKMLIFHLMMRWG